MSEIETMSLSELQQEVEVEVEISEDPVELPEIPDLRPEQRVENIIENLDKEASLAGNTADDSITVSEHKHKRKSSTRNGLRVSTIYWKPIGLLTFEQARQRQPLLLRLTSGRIVMGLFDGNEWVQFIGFGNVDTLSAEIIAAFAVVDHVYSPQVPPDSQWTDERLLTEAKY